MITIDGKNYKASWLTETLEQDAQIVNGENSGRLQGSARMYLEYVGTFFNHRGSLHKDGSCTEAEWGELFLTLCNPKNKHKMSFPFGADEKIEQEVYVTGIKRTLRWSKETNTWTNVLDVEFTAIAPAWLPDGAIKGVKPL